MSEQQTPGFVDAHSHLRATTLSSQGILGCQNLEEALLRFTAMTAVDPTDDALVACSDLISAGVTGVQVMFHTFGTKDFYLQTLDAVLTGISKSGLRALVILGVTDSAEFLPAVATSTDALPSWLPPKSRITTTELAEVYDWATTRYPELNFGIGPVGAQWCSDAMLRELGELAQQGMRVHSHLLESPRQRNWVGENPIDRLERNALLGPKTSLAHGVWCDREDLSRIAAAGAQLVTCPGSNSALRAGTADLDAWQSAGVRFGFGLDSSAEEIKPLAIAASAMDSLTAVSTLTHGGQACTDLNTDLDQVVWENIDLGICRSVRVAGRELYSAGILHNQSEVDQARARIHERMLEDADSRAERHLQLDRLMPSYQKELDRWM